MASAKSDQLVPVPWARIEPHFKAGIRSVAAISKEFGVSRAAIYKHAEKQDPPWTRSLAHDIHAAADRIVDAVTATVNPARVTGQVTAATPAQAKIRDTAIVNAGAQMVADLRLEHRARIRQLRKIISTQLDALTATCETPEVFGVIFDALDSDEALPRDLMARMAEVVGNLPTQVRVTQGLTDCLARCILLEREAYGLNTSEAGQRHLVVVKDYTGKGDPDAPPLPANQEED